VVAELIGVAVDVNNECLVVVLKCCQFASNLSTFGPLVPLETTPWELHSTLYSQFAQIRLYKQAIR
jgi:hypothetical protein